MSKNLFRSTSVVSGMTLLSRVSGFLRDVIMARCFGASGYFDAFIVAFRIPNLMRRLFAEGAFSQSFVPVLADYQQKESKESLRMFISAVAGSLGIVLLLVTVIGVIAAPWLIKLFAAGFPQVGARHDLAVSLLRITFPYLFFISLTALSGAVLNTFNRFWVPAFTPLWLNICMMSAALWLGVYFKVPVMALGIGVLVAGVAQLGFQLPFLWQLNLLAWPRIDFSHPGVRRLLRLMLPSLFGVSVSQLNILVDTLFASFLVSGSISWLYYSDRLMEFPLGVIGVAVSTVILPHLSRHSSLKATKDFSRVIDWALRCILLAGLPAAVILAIIAGPLVSTLFQHGSLFLANDVLMTQKSLAMFSIGIAPFMLIKVLASGFYAKQNMKTPVRIGVVAMLSNIVLNLLLIDSFKHAGIALATSLSAMINSGLLFYFLKKSGSFQPSKGWGFFSLRLAMANAAMAVWLRLGAGDINDWLHASTFWRVEHLSVILGVAGLIYASVLWLSGLRPKHLIVEQVTA